MKNIIGEKNQKKWIKMKQIKVIEYMKIKEVESVLNKLLSVLPNSRLVSITFNVKERRYYGFIEFEPN